MIAIDGIVQASEPAHYALAEELFLEYARQLGVSLCFQGFDSELRQLSTSYGPPTGCLLLAMQDSVAVGCGAVRALQDGACEMKRLYVRPAARGARLGRRLAEQLVAGARARGYGTMRLDTLSHMAPARALYRSLGFVEIGPYYPNPLPGVLYMELDLRDVRGDA